MGYTMAYYGFLVYVLVLLPPTRVAMFLVKLTPSGLLKSCSGWWFEPTPVKNDGLKVSLDDEIPNMMGKSQTKSIPNNQWIAVDSVENVEDFVYQPGSPNGPMPGADHGAT